MAAVCDVHETQRLDAKKAVDEFYGNRAAPRTGTSAS